MCLSDCEISHKSLSALNYKLRKVVRNEHIEIYHKTYNWLLKMMSLINERAINGYNSRLRWKKNLSLHKTH